MAKNICYGAKEALERQMRTSQGGLPFNPVVLTSDQEDALTNRKAWNSKYKLWKLKTNQPHLFANIEKWREAQARENSGGNQAPEGIPGFEQVAPGWLFHMERQVYVEEATQRCLWYDSNTGTYADVHIADDVSEELTLSGTATTSASSATSRATCSGSTGFEVSTQSARHLIIMDLHKASDMFKMELTHIDRPAAMLAVYKHVVGGVMPEVAAKGLHEKLLRRLAGYRGRWIDAALQAVLVESMSAFAVEQHSQAGIAGTVALILGPQLVVATSHGGACAVADALPDDIKDVRIVAESKRSADGCEVCTACVRLDARSAACILLHTDAIEEAAARVAASHVERGHLRAGAVTLLQGPPPSQAAAMRSRAAACVRLLWNLEDVESSATKRSKTDKASEKERKARCRQILLKYTGCQKAIDPVRRKPVRRSLAEAETTLLETLNDVVNARKSGGASAAEATFTKQCRAISECTSSLRGGDLAGDIGWLKMPEFKPGEKVAKEVAVRLPIIRAALALAVG
eukprot:CAMPEP_0117463020 /NCGR_PEP_ID=MMETSP0784-20121206/3356_1 /TAXON_ID=39447 /ORGANISM="" /LENGTH=517 /DNA_ID=CAMNT_0005256807 /DNA_START=42 /DNA_END=1592 /DNA_ORIENTATION=+